MSDMLTCRVVPDDAYGIAISRIMACRSHSGAFLSYQTRIARMAFSGVFPFLNRRQRSSCTCPSSVAPSSVDGFFSSSSYRLRGSPDTFSAQVFVMPFRKDTWYLGCIAVSVFVPRRTCSTQTSRVSI